MLWLVEWRRRLTYVSTTLQSTSVRSSSVGTIISAERLTGVKVRCPRCDQPAATVWRRFDYFGRGLPLYFTKCTQCRRRRPINADEVAFKLLEVGVAQPTEVLGAGAPERDAGTPAAAGAGTASLETAEQLVANRRRAYGQRHALTFEARAQLAEAIGHHGDPAEAALRLHQVVEEQLKEVGHPSPAVVANQYRAAVWTARAGRLPEALDALRRLLPDQEAALGKDHVNTLITRSTVAQLTDQSGDREAAVQMLRDLRPDQLRALGSEHPATEDTQRRLAEWEGE